MERRSATRTVVGRDAQVDLCPADGGMVVSVGRTAIWLDRRDAEDLVETLEIALMISSREAGATAAS